MSDVNNIEVWPASSELRATDHRDSYVSIVGLGVLRGSGIKEGALV